MINILTKKLVIRDHQEYDIYAMYDLLSDEKAWYDKSIGINKPYTIKR